MRTAPFKLLTFMAVASMAAACGDDGGGNNTETDTTVTPDSTGDTTGETGPDTTPPGDTTTTPDGNDVTDTQTCGLRECGTFGNLNCGDCSDKPGTECNDQGRCVVPGQPLGAFCGLTSTCSESSANFPACLDEQCDTNLCLSNTSGGAFALTFFRDWVNVFAGSYCTAACNIYKDSNNDGVNDADAQDDCNPADIVDGPVGNAMRCVNFAPIDSNPVGLCIAGSAFSRCDEPSDCPAGETCELGSVLGILEGRCVAKYKAGDWGDVVGIGGECNADPEVGDGVALCEAGYCEFFGCATSCGGDDDCLTVATGVCSGGTCTGKPGTTCTDDADCSSFECGALDLGDLGAFGRCGPKTCADEYGCGPGFTCSWGWNGSVRNPGPDNSCLRELADGEDLGEACDPDPTDNDIVNGGAVCKSDLCLGARCSQVCSSDEQCGDGGLCGYYEFSDAMIACDEDADCGAGNACTMEDGACYNASTFEYIRAEEDTFVLGLNFCNSLEGSTGSCLSHTDCGASESCELYLQQNYLQDGSVDPDAPVVMAGACLPAQGPGELGDECTDFSDCKSGFCIPITDTFAICSEPCTASADCGSFNIGEDAVNGVCNSYLYSFAGDLERFQNFTYVGLCVFDFGSTADCADDFTCEAATEACFPNAIAGNDPTKASNVEYLCFQVWETAEQAGTKQLGEACDPEAEVGECASGFCTPEVGDETTGYCSQLCNAGDDCGGGDLSCTELVRVPRAGAYAANTGTFGLCLKDQECGGCTSHLDCPGSLVCANLGTAGTPAYQCVPGCETVDDCAAETVSDACNTATDEFGETAMGCFRPNNNYCQ